MDIWQVREDAIRKWVFQSSGLSEDKTIFANQNGPRPSLPFITVLISSILPLGGSDRQQCTFDENGVLGEEVILSVEGEREVSVSIQAFSDKSIGDQNARAILSKIQTSLRLPSMQTLLEEAGLSVFDLGTVRDISGLLDTNFESRAVMEVSLYLVETLSENTTFIETIEVTETETSQTFELSVKGD